MISKRVRRSSSPQENLKQFSLNNSKGIDGTKPITDPDTVLDMENLEINPDGSLSIRKPMLSANAAYGKEHLLYDGEHVAIVYPGGLAIAERGTAAWEGWQIKCSAYYTYVESVPLHSEEDIRLVTSSDFDFSKASFLNVAGATVVGNCFVKAEFLKKAGAIDETLYDADALTKFLPRYVKISKEPDANVWDIVVINPELTKLTTAEGEIPLNPNMCLDNPYAIRDTYGCSVPTVKGIIPYKASDKINSETVVSTKYSDAWESDIPEEPDTDEDGNPVLDEAFLEYMVGLKDSRWGHIIDVSPTPVSSISIRIYREDSAGDAYAEIYSYNFKGTVKLTVTIGVRNMTTGKIVEGYTRQDYTTRNLTPGTSSTGLLDYAPNAGGVVGGAPFVLEWKLEASWNAYALSDNVKGFKISQITESCKSDADFRPFSSLKEGTPFEQVYLKAFCDLPHNSNTYYATWDYSLDGVRWNPYGAHEFTEFSKGVNVKVVNEEWKPISDVDKPSETDYVTRAYVPLNAITAEDTIVGGNSNRPDVLPLAIFLNKLDKYLANGSVVFRFSIATLKRDEAEEDVYKIVATVAQSQFTLTSDIKTTYLETDAPNAVLGEKLYYKKSIYSYGTSDYKSIVHVSDSGSFITPMYNAIDLDAYSGDIVTAVVPWRDYLLISTEKAVYLSSKTSTGFYTKLVSSSIGVDLKDRRSAVAALNGMLFKHGDAVYLAYPNLYASDDTMLMLTDISKPISHILGSVESSEPSFAIYYDDMYVLMLPDESSTRCLIYDTSEKRWSNFTYPVKFYDFFGYSKDGLSTHTAVGSNFEYFIFDAPAGQDVAEEERYADVSGDTIIPIRFMLDTGQKTDSILHTKQFVETKLMFATLSERDSFPLTLYVAIDGDPHVVRTDVSTDAPFWKTQDDLSRGVVGTAFRLGGETTPATGAFNTLRQLIVRHSGKGKSIRYVLEGESLYNFKLYETYVRYKNLNIKQ